MKKTFLAAVIAAAGFSSAALAQGLTVGVSWSNFQEERWKTDEGAIKAALEAAGATYVSADAQSSSAKQLSDIEALMAVSYRGVHADALKHARPWNVKQHWPPLVLWWVENGRLPDWEDGVARLEPGFRHRGLPVREVGQMEGRRRRGLPPPR